MPGLWGDSRKAGEVAGAAVPAAHTAVALNVNLELERAVVHWQPSVSVARVMSITENGKSGAYSALHITGHQFLKKYVKQESNQ